MITNYEENIKVIDGVIKVAKRNEDNKSLKRLEIRKKEEIATRNKEMKVAE